MKNSEYYYGIGLVVATCMVFLGICLMFSNVWSTYSKHMDEKAVAKAECIAVTGQEWNGFRCKDKEEVELDRFDQALVQAEFDWCTAVPERKTHERCEQFQVDDGGGLTLMMTRGVGIGFGVNGQPAIGLGGGLGVSF